MTLGRRALVLVIDGLGIGAMEDVAEKRPQDKGANTLGHVVKATGVELPTLTRLGLGNTLAMSGWYQALGEAERDDFPLQPVPHPPSWWGRSALAYEGADSFAGHQEIMGTILRGGKRVLFREVSRRVESALKRAGYRVDVLDRYPGRPLLVEGSVVVADNIEAEPGLGYNLTVPLDEICFDEAVRMAEVVRNVVEVRRVIVFGSTGYGVDRILQHIEHRSTGQTGVNSPALGAYDEHFRVRHLGYGVDPSQQLPACVKKAGGRVALIGKMADVIDAPADFRDNTADTGKVLEFVRREWQAMEYGLVAATVQETDLAGHEADPTRYARVLRMVDEWLKSFMPLLGSGDALIITADHGNDPINGTGDHTREYVPVIVLVGGALVQEKPSRFGNCLGTRTCLSDVAATVAWFLGTSAPPDGQPLSAALNSQH
ncbi:MAG: phosphopentomutase [Bacillota bacterium]|nr:MAG: phosphopentomutase [Bacillota bacterium]